MLFAFLTGKVTARESSSWITEWVVKWIWKRNAKQNEIEFYWNHGEWIEWKNGEKSVLKKKRGRKNKIQCDIQKLMKLHKRPIERRLFAGQTVNLTRMKIDFRTKESTEPKISTKQTNRRREKNTVESLILFFLKFVDDVSMCNSD